MKNKTHLTTGYIAEHCGVSRSTVLSWVRNGELKTIQLPQGKNSKVRHNRILKEDFNEFARKYKMPEI